MTGQYRPRVLDPHLEALMCQLPAIHIDGLKGVGKTATAVRRAKTVRRLDEPSQHELVRASPEAALASAKPVLLDEWQLVPEVWDAVKRAVDHDRSPGQFILTGSALASSRVRTHSGAARITSVRMRPMTLVERGLSTPTVSLADLLHNPAAPIAGSTACDLGQYAQAIVGSGFPGLQGLSGPVLRSELLSYVDRLMEYDLPEMGLNLRRPSSLRAWLVSYAAATATQTSWSRILDSATSGVDSKPSRGFAQVYLDALSNLRLLDPVPAWLPTRNHLQRLAQSPKHHLADPALAAALLGATTESLLDGSAGSPHVVRDGALLGALFESLAALSLRVFAEPSFARVFHMRADNGRREIDAIVEGPDGRVVACEVKLSPRVNDADVKHLAWLRDQIGPDVVTAVVLTTGPDAYRRPDGIAVVPLALLGP